MWDVGSIDVEEIHEYPLSVKWHIENYFERYLRDDAYYQSPRFIFGGSTWCLRLYPNGDSNVETVGNVELYLEKLQSSIESHEVSFSLGIKNGDGTVYVSELFTDSFEGRGDLSGTAEIATRSQLISDRHKLAPENNLTVFIENLVLTRNLITEDDDQTSTPSGEENSEDIQNEMNVSPSSHIEGVENSEDIQNEMKDSPSSDMEGVELRARNLKDLFMNEEECDVTFKVKNREFRAHLAILIARSPVFASMFRHDMLEKNTGIVNIPDCSAEAFKDLLLYLYTGTVAHSSSDTTLNLYESAVKYDLEHLKRKCIDFMKEDMSIVTFCDILTISLKHNEIKLKKIATDFFTQHIKDILPTVKWQTFLKENPIAANELLIKAMNFYECSKVMNL